MRSVVSLLIGMGYLVGIVVIFLGALYKIQSWEAPAFLGSWDLLTMGLVISALSTIALVVSLVTNDSKPDAETKLVLKDLPDTVDKAEEQLRKEENMIV